MNPNQQDNTPPTSDPKAAPPAPNANAEAGSKVRDAQVKLLDAQAALAAANTSGSANPASARAEAPKPDATPKQETRSARAEASDPGAPKPRVAERAESAASRVAAEAKVHAPSKPVTEYLSDNVAAMLSYLLGWISGLLFLFIDRRPYVRFHAAQSVAIFATLNILILALGSFFLGPLLPHAGNVLYALRHLLELGWLVIAVVLMLRAAGGDRVRVKMASQYGDRAAHGGR
jgi:uncharacterized membrane protein